MNKTLAEEELDRQLVVDCPKDENGKPFGWATHKVSVGKKKLSFSADYYGKLTFEKRDFIGDALEFEWEWDVVETKQCSLGHTHETGRKTKIRKGQSIQWEYVEQLIEWLQLGSWTQTKGKPDPKIQLLKELHDFLKAVEKSDAHLKPASQKLRNKIRGLVQVDNEK